ncbi:hypothetical protein [Legionella sainthelensi]|uniref:hypothetical protein n=1 Tax=Legionella sainthelensi TaxID=28087 RepID=UPI0010562A23|nr:hypothetical protein [Legionella sainthelensi]
MKKKIEKEKVTLPISVNNSFAEENRSSTVLEDSQKDIKYPFTILEHSMTPWNVLKDTWRTYQHAKVEFRHLVALKPERLIFHELVARMQGLVVQEDSPAKGEEIFQQMIKIARQDVVENEDYELIIEAINKEYDELCELLAPIKEGNYKALKLDFEGQKIAEQFLKEAIKANRNEELTEEQNAACFQRTLATLYTRKARELAAKFMNEKLPEILKKHDWEFLPTKPVDESIFLFTTGGSASGKTSSLIKVATGIEEEHHVQWKDMSHHNTDRLCTIVFDKKVDPKQYFYLAGDEARLIKERELEVCDELTTQYGLAVDEVDDAVSIRLDRFEDAINKRKEVVVCAVSTDTETAFHRAYSRGQQAERFTNASALLKSHKDAPNSLKEAFSKFKEDTDNVSILMYDNNSDIEGESDLFCTISSGSKSINVIDSSQLNLWLKKCNMNVELGKLENDEYYELDLYSQPPITPEEYFEPLLKLGYKINYTKKLESETTHSDVSVEQESVEPKVSSKKKPMWEVLSDMGFESVAVPIFKVAQKLEELSKTNPKQAIKSAEEYLAHKTHKKDTEYVRKIQSFVDHLKMTQSKLVKSELHKFKEDQPPKPKDSQFKV